MTERGLSLADAIEQLRRIQATQGSRPWRLVVRKFNPGGLTAHQTTELTGLYAGLDWNAGKVVLEPALPLTELSPEQVDAIAKSVREGGSWHAHQRESALHARIGELEAELARLRTEGLKAP